MDILAAITVCLSCIIGILMALVMLPGAWFMVFVAGLCQWWRGDLFSWWTLGTCVGLAVIGEVLEVALSASGARRSGATRSGAFGAVVGSIVGALIGAPLLFPLGSVLGAIVGAGAGALVIEIFVAERPPGQAFSAARGAMKGRALATGIKTLLALVMALTLGVASAWP